MVVIEQKSAFGRSNKSEKSQIVIIMNYITKKI